MENFDVILEIFCEIIALACADPVTDAWEKIIMKRVPEGKKSRRIANGLMLATLIPALAGIALLGFGLKTVGICLIGASVLIVVLLIILSITKKTKIHK